MFFEEVNLFESVNQDLIIGVSVTVGVTLSGTHLDRL